jgi:hypothetical protein
MMELTDMVKSRQIVDPFFKSFGPTIPSSPESGCDGPASFAEGDDCRSLYIKSHGGF